MKDVSITNFIDNQVISVKQGQNEIFYVNSRKQQTVNLQTQNTSDIMSIFPNKTITRQGKYTGKLRDLESFKISTYMYNQHRALHLLYFVDILH